MITLDVYSVGTGVILAIAGYEIYKQWKIGHDLSEMCKESICEFMKGRGYDVHINNYNEPYFVKGSKRYSYEYIHGLVSENKLNEIY